MHFLFKMGWNTIHVKMLRFQNIAKPSHKKIVRESLTWIFRAGVPMHISTLGSNSRGTLTTTFVLNKFMETAKVIPQVQYRQRSDEMVWMGKKGRSCFRQGRFLPRFRTNNGSRFFEWTGFLRPFWTRGGGRPCRRQKEIKISKSKPKTWHLTLQSQTPQHTERFFLVASPPWLHPLWTLVLQH